ARTGLRVLIGGLGVGFSLGEAVASPEVAQVTVVEREAPVIAWQHGPLAPFSGGALHDPRVAVRHTDLVVWVRAVDAEDPVETFDALCLDIDNGPDWTVTASNDALYGRDGLRALRRRLAPGGVLAVWSAAPSPAFEALLGEVFDTVETREVPVRVPRGMPDVVFLAR
ncbi:MAG: spermidine synthase, partial [Streptomycetaceae bacterium]|nr:spermidine synthase [Streptomycetaceae bacterium]